MIIADTHVHIYLTYDLDLFFSSALKNLSRLGEGTYLLCLTERSDCRFYAQQQERGRSSYGSFELSGNANGTLQVVSNKGGELLILPGRQVATSERIEVIGLGIDEAPPDGTSAVKCIEFFNERKALTVLPWSFGKWTGGRGELIKNLISEKNLSFMLGDPAHRPRLLPECGFFQLGRDFGRKILCGTDPLPLKGEETRVGRYGNSFASGDFLSALQEPQSVLGERLWPWQTATKLVEMRLEKGSRSRSI